MNSQEKRDRLAREVKVARLRKFKTVDRARIAARVSRGTWDNVERGDSVKDFSLAAIEEALDWPAGYALSILADDPVSDGSGERPPGRLAELIERFVETNPRTTNAEVASSVGVAPSTVARWRAHALNELPDAESLRALAVVLHMSEADVLYAAGVDTGYIVETVTEIDDDARAASGDVARFPRAARKGQPRLPK